MRIEVAGAHAASGGTAGLIDRATEAGEAVGVTVQLADASLVCGREHLEVAAEKAVRAQDEGRMTAHTLGGEILLYASGETQVGRAIEKMGVRPDSTELAVVVAGDMAIDEALKVLGLRRDDAVLEATPRKLAAFGITSTELATVDEAQAADIALERVALVDMLR